MAFKHDYTIICDDFRREDNGKLILLGIYMGTIVVSQFPFALPSLTFFSMLDADKPGHYAMKFFLQHLESGKKLVEGHGGAEVHRPGKTLAPVKFGPVQFNAVGAYNFIMELDGHPGPIIVPFDVQLRINMQQGPK